MNLFRGIVLMPTLLIRSEPYILAIRGLGYSYRQAIMLNSIGTTLAIFFWFLVIMAPERIPKLFDKLKQGDKIVNWHKKRQHKNYKQAEKLLFWLHKHKVFFLLPFLLFIMVAIPIPILLPLPLIAILIIKITHYFKWGIIIIVIANLIKSFLLVSAIYGIF